MPLVEFKITEITSDASYTCTTNTANLVYYKFLTNTNDPNYPGNLDRNDLGANIPANCNRPISFMRQAIPNALPLK